MIIIFTYTKYFLINKMSNTDKNTRESKGEKLFNEQGRGIYKQYDTQWSTGNNYASNKISVNRKQLLDKGTAQELNTYLNFGVFPTFADTYPDDVKGEYDKEGKLISSDYYMPKGYGPGTPGVRSLFNRAGAIVIGSKQGSYAVDPRSGNQTHIWRIVNNVPLMDSPKARERIDQQLSCTISDLVQASYSGKMGQETYAYSDFMYCKHLGRVSNNYLITLRRFPSPVDDFIGFVGDYEPNNPDPNFSYSSKNPACIGCMVTWLGVSGNELNNILKYNYRMPFKEQQSQMEDSKTDADSNTTLLGGLFSGFDKSYQKQYLEGRGGEAFNSAMYSMFNIKLGNPPYTDHRGFKDRNKVYGPIDAIKSTYIRSDEGLVFNHKMTLVFEYELRSYNGINPRQAMLDLISNILNVTYITGSFWGGGIKSYGAAQSNIFTNLNIFKCKGGFTDFADAMAKDLSDIGSRFSSALGFGGGEEFTLAGAWNALKGALNTLGGMLMGGMLNKLGRPQKAMYNSLLSPAPIGFWHVTIGNPKAPIMSIGNMIITNVQIEHNGPLGLDNFPTGLKVTVELDRGKPRDLRDIEKLYMHGNDRIYAPMTDKVFNMYKNSIQYKDALKNKSTYDPVFKTKTTNDKGEVVEASLYDYTKTGETERTVARNTTDAKGKNITVTTTSTYNKYEPKMNAEFAKELGNVNFKKYFGTSDTYSILFASTEQEYGAAKEKYAGSMQPTEAGTNNNNQSAQ